MPAADGRHGRPAVRRVQLAGGPSWAAARSGGQTMTQSPFWICLMPWVVGQKLFTAGSNVEVPAEGRVRAVLCSESQIAFWSSLPAPLTPGDEDLPGVPRRGRLRLEDRCRAASRGRAGLEVVDDLWRPPPSLVDERLVRLEDGDRQQPSASAPSPSGGPGAGKRLNIIGGL